MGLGHSKPGFRALLLGLDSAGKTTLLKGLTNQEITEGPTTTHNVGSLKLAKGGDALLFDLGGQQKLITFWRQYYSGTGIILFVIDSSDTQRVSNAKDELYRLIYEDELIGIPLLVIANKQDMPDALSPEEIATELELNYLAPRAVHIVGACAKTKEGFTEITQWVQAHAVTVSNLPKHLASYNEELNQLQKQKQVDQQARNQTKNNSSRRASLASTVDYESKTSTPASPPDNGSLNIGLQLSVGDSNQQPTQQAQISPKSQQSSAQPNNRIPSSSTTDFQSPNADPQSISLQSNSITSTPRRPRLTISIEQQVAQSELHRQLLAQVSASGERPIHRPTSHLTEELNKDGIPISQRHVDEFNPGKDDVVLEAPIFTRNVKRSSVMVNSTPKVTSVAEDPNDTNDLQATTHTTLPSTAENDEPPELSPITPIVTSQSLDSASFGGKTTPQSAPQTLAALQQPSVSERDSFNRLDSFTRRISTTSRSSVTQPSPASRPRRRSSVGIAPNMLQTEEIEGISRSRKISLSQTQQEEDNEGEFNALNDPLVGHEELLQEPNLDTVKENEAVE